MNFLTRLKCSNCRRPHSVDRIQGICDACGSPLFPRYDLEAINRNMDERAIQKREVDNLAALGSPPHPQGVKFCESQGSLYALDPCR